MTRDIRDRLAEALNWKSWGRPADVSPEDAWRQTGPLSRRVYLEQADDLLAALPSVGLTINTLESPSQGGETTNHG